MGKLFERIRDAVEAEQFIVSWHADERCEERGVAPWQLAVELPDAELLRERPGSKPHPSVVVRQTLADGQSVEVIWSWLEIQGCAQLVTVYFPD